MAYTLASSSVNVNEGSNVTITLYTTGLTDGTLVPYNIYGTGINLQDFNNRTLLSGNFSIRGNQASIKLDIKNDFQTEYVETFTLTLPNTGFNESINININDTSKTNSSLIAKFYVTADQLVVLEGQTAKFNIRATNVDPGTAVAYSIYGIQKEDLTNQSLINGILTLNSTDVPNETSANISLPILADYLTEGQETIVLVLSPDFPYVLELSATIVVQDTSFNIDPYYYLSTDKDRVVEGSNVTIYLNTYNVPDGTVIPWRIFPLDPINGGITDSDFENVSNLSGFFPPLSANVANIILQIRDDFVFENTEVFYVGIPETIYATGYISILDSGNTLITTDDTFTGNINIKFLDPAVLQANLGSVTKSLSFWKDTTGLLSENMVLQGKTSYEVPDSLALYHPFSYVIRSKISIENWRNSIKSVLHPAGLTIFSEINNDTALAEILSLAVKTTGDSTISTSDPITSDATDVDASSTLLDISRIQI